MARPELMKEAYVQRIIGHHTTPDDCGRVFAQTRPKLAAFTHVVQIASPQVPPPTLDDALWAQDVVDPIVLELCRLRIARTAGSMRNV